MTTSERPPHVPRRHWTAPLYLRANPVLARILASRWHPLISRWVALLRITGRRSGMQYQICVGYSQPTANVIDILVSDASNRTWWRNFIGGGPVDVVLRGLERPGRATAYAAPAAGFKEVADRAIPGIVGRRGARTFFALPAFDPYRGLSEEDLQRLAGFAVAVTIALEPRTVG